jgi:prevent-host-death family protein
MTLTVKVAEAKARLSELLAKAEAGEDIIIARGHAPIAKLTGLPKDPDIAAIIEEIKTARNAFARAPVTVEEILAWRHEGHRY